MKKTYRVTVGAKTFVVEVEEAEGGGISVTPTSEAVVVTAQAASEPGQGALIKETEHGTVGDKGTVKAPVRGVVISVKCRAGDHVKAGDVLCTLEAMKMENEILSSKPGTVKVVHVVPGKAVEPNEVLLIIDESEGS